MSNALQPVQITLTFEPAGETTRIRWEGQSIGHPTSEFVAPYQGEDLALVVRALDSLQTGVNMFTATERSRLLALGLVDGFGNVLPDAQQRVGRIFCTRRLMRIAMVAEHSTSHGTVRLPRGAHLR